MKILIVFVVLTAVLGAPRHVFALSVPDFPACPNPGGSLKVSYSSGIHGIAGRSEVFEGQDSVFLISESTTVQCYCAPDGSGIQTNWWKASSLSGEEKTSLIADGWIYIPDGSVWGLDPSDWLAKNISISCGEKGGSGVSSSTSSNSNTSTTNTIMHTIIPSILSFADTGRRILFRKVFLSLGVLLCLFGAMVFLITQEPSASLPKKHSRKRSQS